MTPPTFLLHFNEDWALTVWSGPPLYVIHRGCKRRARASKLYYSLLCEGFNRRGEKRLRCNVCRKRFPTLFECQIALLGARPSSPAAIIVIPGEGLFP